MESRRWEEIQAAFDAVVELDPAARVSRLKALGSTDPELRAAVESLLAADTEAEERLAPLEAAFLPQTALTPDPLGLSGRTISHFQVLEPLGAGGMGVVYRAQDIGLGRAVALKFLLPLFSLDAAAKARFLREAHAAAALDHPNLCTIYEVGESDDGRLFLAMALYPGETLRARLAREGPLPVGQALETTRQIAEGLACAHAAGIVHRDLKPGNVMLLPDGTVKILDFGLAKARDQSLSASSARLGTAAYMAPEQIRGEEVDARTDLWALGVVLYEMLTGRKPFGGEQAVAMAHAILHDEPVAPSTLRGDVPAAVEDLVLRLLQNDPAKRYRAAAELMGDVVRVRTIAEGAIRSGRPRWLRASHILTGNRRRMVLVSAALLVSALGYATIVRKSGHSAVAAERTAIAVLPFQNLSAGGPHAYFAGGLHQEILTQLSKAAALKVISRTSVMGYAGPNTPSLRQIASELGVRSVVEGSVQVEGTRLRVNVQLIDAATDVNLWAEGYDGTLDDAFAIQSDIARRVVAAVGAALDPPEQQRLAEAPTQNANAYRLYLRATELRFDEEQAANSAAEELLKEALVLDAGFAVARALLAHVYITRAYSFGESRRWADSGLVLARGAIAHDPDLALGYSALGIAQLEAGRLAEALSAFQKELEASPSRAEGMLRLGWVWFLRGRLDEAVRLWVKARRLDPANWLIALDLALAAIVFGDYESAERWQNAAEARAADHPYVRLGRVLLTLRRGRTGDAVAQAERFLADQPGSFLALEALTQARLHAGHYELARPHLEAMRRVAPGDWNFWGLTHRSLYGWTLLKLGDADGGVEVLHELLRDARVRLAEGDERPGLLREIAAIHAALGERQRALEWLARAIDAGWRLDPLHPSPLFEPIRAEQEYSQLMARVAVSLRRMSGRIEKSEIWSGPS